MTATRLHKREIVGKRLSYDLVRPYRPLLGDCRGQGVIATLSDWSIGNGYAQNMSSLAWPSANRAIFVPFRVPVPVTIDKLAMGTGTGTGGNYDQGIYDEFGNLVIATGSTARPGASQDSIVDIADTVLMPGLYYLAMALDGTNTVQHVSMNLTAQTKLMGMRQMDTAFPLPSTATFATHASVMFPNFAAYIKREVLKPWRGQVRMPPLNTIGTMHKDSCASVIAGSSIGLIAEASRVGGANVAYYVPFVLHEYATAQHLGYLVGGTSNGNVDLGVYDGNGNLLISSGSTAQGTASTYQSIDITDTRLGPGFYYMALTLSSATGTFRGIAPADEHCMSAGQFLVETTVGFGLPSTMTPAHSTSATPFLPLMAVHFSSLV